MFNGDFKTVLVFYGKVGKIIWCFIFIATAVYLHLVFTNNFFPNLVKSRCGICNIHERSLRDIRDANELLHQKCTEFHMIEVYKYCHDFCIIWSETSFGCNRVFTLLEISAYLNFQTLLSYGFDRTAYCSCYILRLFNPNHVSWIVSM